MKILILEDSIGRVEEFMNRIYNRWPDDALVTIVNHATLAIENLQNNKYDMLFLDHDLGGKEIEYDEENCGSQVADWLSKNPIDSKIIIHSLNAPAATRMVKSIKGSFYVPFLWTEDQFNKHIIGYSINDRR